jgi:hypothetical protein
MKCEECGQNRFYSRYKNGMKIALVCPLCGHESPIKPKKKKDKPAMEDPKLEKDGDK